MATIDDKSIITDIIANNGMYSDDPIPQAIYEYQTLDNRTVFSICYSTSDIVNLFNSLYVKQPTLLWSKSGVTYYYNKNYLNICKK